MQTLPQNQQLDSPQFEALLTPHRALDAKGVRGVIAIAAVLASVPGILFFAIGAWPVFGLLGLDVLALWWAMSANLHAGRAFEEVILWRDKLQIRHVAANGTEKRHDFNPFWVKLQVTKDFDDNVTRLTLRDRKEHLEIGAFLNSTDKASFVSRFQPALSGTKT